MMSSYCLSSEVRKKKHEIYSCSMESTDKIKDIYFIYSVFLKRDITP